MPRFSFGLLFLLLLWHPVLATPPDDYFGQWKGKTEDGKPIVIMIDRAGTGFSLEYHADDMNLAKTPFIPSGKPGVFEQQKSTGLFGLFASKGIESLNDAPILWARLDGATLIFYRLEVTGNGHMTLDRMQIGNNGGQAEMKLTRIVNGTTELTWQASLEHRP
ncbi:MAG: hypothetical protein H6851_09545 [Geminicoccaceae bacterium]|nr:hypothetical protein [Geminicoccaceae bacterium]